MDKIASGFNVPDDMLKKEPDGELISLIYDSLSGISQNDCLLIYRYCMARRRNTDLPIDRDYLTWLWHEMTGENLR
jgi:hypothetical protein